MTAITSLSNYQLAAVFLYAKSLDVEDRELFLTSVMAALVSCADLSDEAVEVACRQALSLLSLRVSERAASDLALPA